MWISVHTGIDGPKLREFRKKLKCSKFEATGILVYLWFWGLENAEKDGKILHADREDIEECLIGSSVGCKLIPTSIVDALVETGWIDETDEGLYIHDWEIWQEQWYKAKERREKDAKRKRESRKKEVQNAKNLSEENPKDSPSDSPQNDTDKDKEYTANDKKTDKKKNDYTDGFIAFWEAYPRKIGKAEAYKKYKTRLKDGWTDGELLEAAKNYAYQCKKLRTEPQYIKHPKTFLSDSTPFTDYLPKKQLTLVPEEQPDKSNPFVEYGGVIE